MASATAYTLINAYWVANWPEDAPAYFENIDWSLEDAPAALVLVEIFADAYRQVSIGAGSPLANRWREYGQIHVHALVPQGTGSAEARRLVKVGVDLFRGTVLGGITFTEASIGAGEKGVNDGNYYRMTGTIDFERDEE